MDSEPPQQRIIMAYVALVLIWSTTPLAVVLSMRDLDAIWALSIRMGAAAVLSMLALRLAGLRMSWDRRAWKLYGVGSLSMFAAMLFTYLGARYIASGLISVLYGLSPLMVALLARLVVPGTVILPLQWVGMLTGLGGLAFIFLHGQHLARTEIIGVIWVLAGVLSYVVSAVWLKKIGATLHPLVQTNGALWLSALGCVLVLPFAGGPVPQHWPGTVTIVALVYSASFGSIVAMLCYFYLLRHISAHSVSLITLLTPVIALLLGVLLLGERFRPETLGGMALILGGLTLYYLRDIWLLVESRRLKNARRAGSL
ncbi:MAG: DMT family transporter [Moraxellaceae bacterium]|nr:DMT family transporter [Moraxellaceae bacterium]